MATKNRGKEGSDDRLFGNKKMQVKIANAVYDMSFLLERGYAEKSSKALIGNRYKLNERQIKAVAGMSAGQSSLDKRKRTCLTPKEIAGKKVIIDGFNVLIILESILSEAYIFRGLDECYRDLSSVHGSYKRVNQTQEAITLVGDYLNAAKVEQVTWVFDKPVSNSGRLKSLLASIAEERNYNWSILLDFNPDKFLVASNEICISSDSWIIENCESWFNLIGELFSEGIIQSDLVLDAGFAINEL